MRQPFPHRRGAEAALGVQRAAIFRQIQRRLNAEGPFYPLFQPSQAIVSSKNLTNATLNFTWVLDVSAVGTR